jgi:hypothetical protein
MTANVPFEAAGFDNITITGVPEPSSIVLSAIGAVGFLAVRRYRASHQKSKPLRRVAPLKQFAHLCIVLDHPVAVFIVAFVSVFLFDVRAEVHPRRVPPAEERLAGSVLSRGQTIEDTGPLTKKRMETIDGETLAAAKDFIKRQVFWNLLSNAVKFTPKNGSVQILLERVNSHLEVSIIDNGEGIDPEFLPHVFDRFRQADASTSRQMEAWAWD